LPRPVPGHYRRPSALASFAQEVARSCELPFDKLPSIRPSVRPDESVLLRTTRDERGDFR
jgi:hypothetical protein